MAVAATLLETCNFPDADCVKQNEREDANKRTEQQNLFADIH